MTDKKKPPQGRGNQTFHTADYSRNRRLAKVIEITPDGHSVLVRCPYCEQLHIHANPTPQEPLRLRNAPCDQSRTYVLSEVPA